MEEQENASLCDYLDTHAYFKKHNLKVYFEDAITQMLSYRLENNKTKPTKFFKEYFCSVHQGTHILFREYSFVSATLYNRLCVMKAIMQIYKPLLYNDEKMTARDYHSLLQLVWPDFSFQVANAPFALLEVKENEEPTLSFLEFIKSLKQSFCVGEFDYEASIINSQIKARIEEFNKITKQGNRSNANLSEADFLSSLEDNQSDQASSWSIASNLVQNSEFKRMLGLKESNSFSSDEPTDGAGGSKLSRSSSESKDASKSDLNVSTFSRASSASLRGRLSGKQLSNSLTLLQTEKLDSENNFASRRHRSKSAVAIQRSYHHTRT